MTNQTQDIHTVFVDMDGVLADFVGGVAKLFRADPYELRRTWPAGDYDICRVLGIRKQDFWERITLAGSRFWENLEIESGAEKIVSLTTGIVGKRRVFIVTQPSLDSSSVLGKKRWMERHIGWNYNNYIFCSRKELLARPGTLLIDDNDLNCYKFRQAGGQACIWAQPWNSKHQFIDSRWQELQDRLMGRGE